MSDLDGDLPAISSRPRTLVLMISAAEIEAAMLGPNGAELAPRISLSRDAAGPLADELPALWPALEALGEFDRITVSTTLGALDPPDPGALASELERQSLRPVRMIGAAELRWRQVIQQVGVELVLALGAELESALFLDGAHVPGLVLGRHLFRKGRTYRDYLAPRVLARKGIHTWNRRLGRALTEVLAVWNPSTLYLTGPNAAHVELALPPSVVVVPSTESLVGAVAPWHAAPTPSR